MRQLILLAFLVLNCHSLAQSPIDNLLVKIEDASSQDNHSLVVELSLQLQHLNPPDSVLMDVLYYQAQHAQALGDFETANHSYLALLALIETIHGKASMLYIWNLEDYTMMLYQSGQQEKVVTWYQEALTTAKANQHYLEYVYLGYSLGAYYELIGAMTYAIRSYKDALQFVPKSGEENATIHIMILRSLARVLEIQHRYDQAESLYKEAIQLAKDTLQESDPNRYILVNDFGMLYFFTRRYKKALPHFEYLKQLIDSKKIPIDFNTSLLANLADCYAHLGRYKEAENIYLQVEEIERTTIEDSYSNYPVTISRMGDLYAFQGHYEKARTFHLRAIDLAKEYFLPQNLYLFYNMEQAYLFFESIKDWQQVQAIALDCFRSNCMDSIATPNILENIQKLAQEQTFATMPYALKSLKIASKSYWERYSIEKDIDLLHHAYNLQLATRLILHRLKNSFSTEWDKLELLSTIQEISELGILISQALYEKTGDLVYQNSAFDFLENNKYVLLQEALQNKEAKVFGNLPDSLIQKEEALEQGLLIAKTKKINATTARSKQKAIEDYNRILTKIDQFKIKLQEQYPAYYEYKYVSKKFSISDLQKQLDSSELLIEYFIGKEHVYIYSIDHKNVYYNTLPITQQMIKNQVKKFRKVLSNYQYILKNKDAALQEYKTLAYWFYSQLVAPAIAPSGKKEHLIIIPDGLLGHLPFEAFLTVVPNQTSPLDQLTFLLQSHKISYAYSSNLLSKNVSKVFHNSQILAMGATYTALPPKNNLNRSVELSKLRKNLAPLEAISHELEALKPIVQGRYYYGAAANEKTFKAEASNYAILHLAMHGILNEKHPILSSLAFTEDADPDEDNFLQAFEISQMKLNAALVVLSACETGYGKFKQGEGILSLARSFMYAGVPSMVVSLWQVNDGSTSIIMSAFYKNLAEGMDKAAALQKAKLDYIHQAQGVTRHPAFWAPFIQLGDASPIPLQAKRFPWWLLGTIGVLFALFFIWRIKREQ